VLFEGLENHVVVESANRRVENLLFDMHVRSEIRGELPDQRFPIALSRFNLFEGRFDLAVPTREQRGRTVRVASMFLGGRGLLFLGCHPGRTGNSGAHPSLGRFAIIGCSHAWHAACVLDDQ